MTTRDEVPAGETAAIATTDGSATITPAATAENRAAGASELLAKTLLEVVGVAALARYAAAQTDDPRLKGLFQRLAAAEERQEQLLRVQAAATLGLAAPRRWLGMSRGVAVACVAAASAGASVAAGVAVAARLWAARRAVNAVAPA